MKKIYGYIKNYKEAYLIVHAIRLGILEPMTQRLHLKESQGLETGDIYYFIENNMKRWTDGRVWSPSKISGEFLKYYELPRYFNKSLIDKFSKKNSSVNLGWKKIKEKHINSMTLHKKTICIKHENISYHIIAYYRPIFEKTNILDYTFFKNLNESLKKHPELKSDDFLKNEMQQEINFYNKFEIDIRFSNLMVNNKERLQKEIMTINLLANLANRNNFKKNCFDHNMNM